MATTGTTPRADPRGAGRCAPGVALPSNPEVRIGRAAAVLACALALAPSSVFGQGYSGGLLIPPAGDLEPGTPRRHGLRFDASIGVEETLTSNANFDRSTDQPRRWDLVTTITPGFRVSGGGAHTSISGAVFVPVLLYARTGADNNRVLPDVSLVATGETLDRHLFIEAGA